IQVAYASDDLQGVASPGVSGTHPPEEALRLLLAGTGVRYRFTAPRTITLWRDAAAVGAVALEPVQVEGALARETAWGPVPAGALPTRSATATKTDAAILETPQSVSV